MRAPSLALALSSLALAACTSRDASTPLAPAVATEAKTVSRIRRPSPPINVTATAGVASAQLSWTPGSNNGSAITYFTVRSTPATTPLRLTAPVTVATVTGLTSGVSYTFTVTATNAAGESSPSTPSNAVVPKDTSVTPPPPLPNGGRWVTAYYAGYQRALYPEAAVDFQHLTHLVVSRIVPTSSGGLVTNFDIDPVAGPAMARDLTSRAHAAGRKAILMVGGAGTHDAWVGAASAANRATFIANLLRTMDSYGFDGLDLDWEPIQDTDQPAVLALLQALRTARPAMLLTIPVGWVSVNFPGVIGSWYAQIAPLVDQMNVMTYGMAGPWPGWVSWHSSALFDEAGNRPSSVASSLARYVAVGVPRGKLGGGIAFSGSCWRGVSAPRQSITSASLVAGDNTMSYTNIMQSYYATSARQWDGAAQAPWLGFALPTGPAGCTFISYEDTQSIGAKGTWLKSAGYGGAIIWTVNQGYLPWAASGSRDPLLVAAFDAIVP